MALKKIRMILLFLTLKILKWKKISYQMNFLIMYILKAIGRFFQKKGIRPEWDLNPRPSGYSARALLLHHRVDNSSFFNFAYLC
jgi:hypothetical protein